MKNQRYSPYNKKQYINSTHIIPSDPLIIGKQLVNSLNQQLQEAFRPEESEPDLEEFKQLIDSIVNDSSTMKSSPSANYGFMDEHGIYRYKESVSHGSSPNHDQSRFSPKKNNKNNEFDTGSQFQIMKNSSFTFRDVGGYETVKKELLQTADILINFEKYKQYNVRTPKGIIFEGPPGNGKTLMAKGFCGELNVTFIPVSGSEFSEKYVGVGASRIRELFNLAYENRPSVIFIDEIDALARKRGNDLVTSNSEKDQTLNQLLTSLDGFRDSNGIFVIGATNRLDLLDAALIRPGRMDKNIFIGNPDYATRKAILQIHLHGKPMAKDITLDELVEMTGGFSGAQIENLLNEAMLRALRENRQEMNRDDLEYISHRVISGWQSTESKFSEDILERIVIHEIGHAIVGMFCHEHAKLKKVCLNLWSPRTPGYTIFESKDENVNIYTKTGLMQHLMVLLSGRIAEDVFFGYSVTTGARKDFEEAYKLAQNMITTYGFGKQTIYPEMSDMSKYVIDQEVSELILKAQENALVIIHNCRELMLDCSTILRSSNVLTPDQILRLMELDYPVLLHEYMALGQNYETDTPTPNESILPR